MNKNLYLILSYTCRSFFTAYHYISLNIALRKASAKVKAY